MQKLQPALREYLTKAARGCVSSMSSPATWTPAPAPTRPSRSKPRPKIPSAKELKKKKKLGVF